MVQDFVSNGTAVAPPLTIIIAPPVIALLAGRQDRWGLVSAIVIIPVGVLMVIGSVGEALASATPDVPRTVQVALSTVDAVLSASLVVLAVAVVVARIMGSSRGA